MNRTKYFAFGLLSFVTQLIYAQDLEEKRGSFLLTGLGGAYTSLQDDGISPLLYSGAGGSAFLGLQLDNKNIIQNAEVRFDFTIIGTERTGSEIYNYNTSGFYQLYFKKLALRSSESKLQIYPGLEASFNIAIRSHQGFTNNALHIDNRLALAPALKVDFPFSFFKSDFTLVSNTALPLLNYAVRPIFASTRLPGSIGNTENSYADYLKNGNIVSWGSYFKFKQALSLQYKFRSGNGVSLNYNWFIERYKAINPVNVAQHSLSISTMFRL